MSSDAPRRRIEAHALLSLATAFVAALVITGGMTRWWPRGAADVDQIVVPLVLFPLLWVITGLTLYAARRRALAWGVTCVLTVAHAALIVSGGR